MHFLVFLSLFMLTGCAAINRPLEPGEKAVPVLDFRNGQFFEVPVAE